MDFPTLLQNSTLIVVALIVLALVVYLVGVIYYLRKGGNHLAKLAGGLQKIADDTEPLEGHLVTINGALTELHGGLESIDNHLVGIAKVFKLIK